MPMLACHVPARATTHALSWSWHQHGGAGVWQIGPHRPTWRSCSSRCGWTCLNSAFAALHSPTLHASVVAPESAPTIGGCSDPHIPASPGCSAAAAGHRPGHTPAATASDMPGKPPCASQCHRGLDMWSHEDAAEVSAVSVSQQ